MSDRAKRDGKAAFVDDYDSESGRVVPGTTVHAAAAAAAVSPSEPRKPSADTSKRTSSPNKSRNRPRPPDVASDSGYSSHTQGTGASTSSTAESRRPTRQSGKDLVNADATRSRPALDNARQETNRDSPVKIPMPSQHNQSPKRSARPDRPDQRPVKEPEPYRSNSTAMRPPSRRLSTSSRPKDTSYRDSTCTDPNCEYNQIPQQSRGERHAHRPSNLDRLPQIHQPEPPGYGGPHGASASAFPPTSTYPGLISNTLSMLPQRPSPFPSTRPRPMSYHAGVAQPVPDMWYGPDIPPYDQYGAQRPPIPSASQPPPYHDPYAQYRQPTSRPHDPPSIPYLGRSPLSPAAPSPRSPVEPVSNIPYRDPLMDGLSTRMRDNTMLLPQSTRAYDQPVLGSYASALPGPSTQQYSTRRATSSIPGSIYDDDSSIYSSDSETEGHRARTREDGFDSFVSSPPMHRPSLRHTVSGPPIPYGDRRRSSQSSRRDRSRSGAGNQNRRSYYGEDVPFGVLDPNRTLRAIRRDSSPSRSYHSSIGTSGSSKSKYTSHSNSPASDRGRETRISKDAEAYQAYTRGAPGPPEYVTEALLAARGSSTAENRRSTTGNTRHRAPSIISTGSSARSHRSHRPSLDGTGGSTKVIYTEDGQTRISVPHGTTIEVKGGMETRTLTLETPVDGGPAELVVGRAGSTAEYAYRAGGSVRSSAGGAGTGRNSRMSERSAGSAAPRGRRESSARRSGYEERR